MPPTQPDLSTVARSNGASPAAPARPGRAGAVASWADDRLGLAKFNRRLIRKVFPDHWSFMLGEIALWSFVVLLVTGVLLTLWFDPSMAEVVYEGSYDPLRGVPMSAAYASTVDISFDVRGGLLIRQMHHWSAHLFIGAMLLHLLRHALTGSFRKPREINWIIGCTLLLLGTIEGFLGYSLPDDLLSGTGIRAADGFVKATPVVGSYLSLLAFGGEFPGDAAIPRLYVLHVLLIPGLIIALLAVHLILIVYYKHTQWPGPGRTEKNVVGYPLLPVYLAKAGGFFLTIFGIIALMGALLTINPVWKYGPYDPTKITAGVQPDWYLAWPDGLLRIIPAWETHLWGHTVSWNIIIPIMVAPMALLTVVVLLPFIEAWLTGDKREHHLLQRPRNAPTRTAFMASLVAFYGVAWASGGNDIIATQLHLSINQITYAFRVLIFLAPLLAFVVTKRWCIALQRADNERLLHGYETGVLSRSPSGGYSEKHRPLDAAKAYTLTARERAEPLPEVEETDADGVRRPGARRRSLRARLSRAAVADDVAKPTAEELAAAHADSEPAAVEARGTSGRR